MGNRAHYFVFAKRTLLALWIAALMIAVSSCSNPNRPHAWITTDPPTPAGKAPFTLTFDGTKSKSPQGQIVSYAWDFGDRGTGAGATITHTYDRRGNYRASLTVKDDQGQADTSYTVVTVTSEPIQIGLSVGWREYSRAGISSCDGPPADSSGKAWFDPDYNASAWTSINLYEGISLGGNAKQRDFFYRTPLNVTPEMLKRAKVQMLIFHDDAFRLWVNGQLVPSAEFDNPGEAGCHQELGRFKTKGFITKYLHEGRNTLALHLTSGDNRAGEPYIQVFLYAIFE